MIEVGQKVYCVETYDNTLYIVVGAVTHISPKGKSISVLFEDGRKTRCKSVSSYDGKLLILDTERNEPMYDEYDKAYSAAQVKLESHNLWVRDTVEEAVQQAMFVLNEKLFYLIPNLDGVEPDLIDLLVSKGKQRLIK